MVFTIVAISITDLFLVFRRPLLNVFSESPIAVDKNNDFYQVIDKYATDAGSWRMYPNLFSNKGTLNAYDVAYDAEHSKIFAKDFNDEAYKGEVYLEYGGKASYVFWSTNKLIVNFNTEKVTHLVINQNYDAGWRVKGKVAESFNGLLSTIVTPSDKTVEFYYLPTAFIMGLIVTLVSIISVVTLSFKYPKKENHR